MRKKGRYKDGRIRYILEWKEGQDHKAIAVPKPEKLYLLLTQIDPTKKDNKLKGGNGL